MTGGRLRHDDLGNRRQGLGPDFYFTISFNPERSGYALSPLAGAMEELAQGGIRVKKVAVRVAAVAGGLVALILAGGAQMGRY